MPPNYDAEYIFKTLQRHDFAVVSNQSGDGTTSTRVMAYACKRDLCEFYLLTPKTAPKLREFMKNPDASLLVFSKAKDNADSSQITVKGKVTIHRDIGSPAIQEGIRIYADKTGILSQQSSSNLPADYAFMVLKPKEISLRLYIDILHNIPATKITF